MEEDIRPVDHPLPFLGFAKIPLHFQHRDPQGSGEV